MKHTARFSFPHPVRLRSIQQKSLACALAFLGFSCAHHRDVRGGADNVHSVTVRGTEKTYTERDAISQADDYCDQWEKRAGILTQKSGYIGTTMDETTRDTVRKASTAAILLGGVGSASADDDDVRHGGNVVGAAGTVGAVMTGGENYETTMTFKCL